MLDFGVRLYNLDMQTKFIQKQQLFVKTEL